ncbi:hypothetical protein ACP2AV_09405 [Aliiroseovarius sp. PTFE2010]|uniref:hypothetical protein n=1 Tax=Aliiroseovarius sp. PTFE2010 TaxID=3417190 RepID=UPI003CF9A550
MRRPVATYVVLCVAFGRSIAGRLNRAAQGCGTRADRGAAQVRLGGKINMSRPRVFTTWLADKGRAVGVDAALKVHVKPRLAAYRFAKMIAFLNASPMIARRRMIAKGLKHRGTAEAMA